MLEEIFDRITHEKDALAKALSLIPSLYYGFDDTYKIILKELQNLKLGSEAEILLAEACYIENRSNLLEGLAKKAISFFRTSPLRGYKTLAFYIPYLIKVGKEENLLDNILTFFYEALTSGALDLYDVNNFFEVFFRYCWLFGIEIESFINEVKEFYKKYRVMLDFYDVLTSYTKSSGFLPPPEKSVIYLYENIYKKIEVLELPHIRLSSSLILALFQIGLKEKAWSELQKAISLYPIEIDSFKLFSSVEKLRARAGLLFALTGKNTSNELLKATEDLLESLFELIKYVLWKYDAFRKGKEIFLYDINDFIEYMRELGEEEIIREKEVRENLNYYFLVVINHLSEIIDATLTNLSNSYLSECPIKTDEIASRIVNLLKKVKYFDPSFKASQFSTLGLLWSKYDTNETINMFKHAEENVISYCQREKEKFYCNTLIYDICVKLGRSFFMSKNNEILEYFLHLLEKSNYFKGNRFSIRGFISGIYGLCILKNYARNFR